MKDVLRCLCLGLIVALVTVAGVALATWYAGPYVEGWTWREPAAGLLFIEAMAMAAIAMLSMPYEPRLRRWNSWRDPLAIGFRLDLTASELNPPQRLRPDLRWYWRAVPPLLGALALGGWVLATIDAPPPLVDLVSQDQAVAAAERFAAQRAPEANLRAQRVEFTTVTLALKEFGPAAQVVAPEDDPDTLAFDVWLSASTLPPDDPTSGAHVIIDAETGEVVATSGLPGP